MPELPLTPYPLRDDVRACIPVYFELAELRVQKSWNWETLIQCEGMSNSDVQELVSSASDIGASSSSSGIQHDNTSYHIISYVVHIVLSSSPEFRQLYTAHMAFI